MSDCEFDVVNDDNKDCDYEFLKKSRIIDHWKTVTERYYSPEFYVNPMNTEDSNQDSLILRHSNKLRLTTLSPNHDIIAKDLKVIKVDFETGKKNRMDNKTKGKWKRGAQKLEEPSVIAIIECENKQIFKIRSGVKGNLMEVNRRLVNNPELVKTMTWSNGYIAAILPQLQTGDRFVPAKYVIRKLADKDKGEIKQEIKQEVEIKQEAGIKQEAEIKQEVEIKQEPEIKQESEIKQEA